MFAAALIAATILPAQSEALLVGLILAGSYSTPALVAVASLGNVLGSVINWALGRGVERFKHARWFPVDVAKMAAAERWYRRYGLWSLLASWVPVIGDPLTVIAGVLKVRFLPFLVLVTIAKTGRYIVLALVVTVWA
nr:YqaA family protein [Rhizobium halophytocola]